MNIIFIICCVKTNTIFFNNHDSTQDIEIVVRNQFKLMRVDLMRTENMYPFFIKNISISKQRYYFSEKNGDLKEVETKNLSYYNNLTTIINLNIDNCGFKPCTNCFLFLLCEDNKSFNVGFFNIDVDHNLKIIDPPHFITQNESVGLEVVNSSIHLLNKENEDERKEWKTREIVFFVLSSLVFAVLVVFACLSFSKALKKDREEELIK